MKKPVNPKVQKVQELRRSNAATPVPSKKVYNRKKVKKINPPKPGKIE